MDCAGGGLDHDGVLVGEVVRHLMQLALVGYEPSRPTAPGVTAVSGLESGSQVAEGDSLARAFATCRATRTRRVDAACRAAEHRFDDSPPSLEGSGLDVADDLVARDEGKAHDLLEITRAAAVQGREVRAADARKAGPHADPAGTRNREWLDLDQLERSDADALA